MSACRSCNAPLRWVKTTTGADMPLNPDLRVGGNIELIDGIAHVVKPDGTPRYTSHHSDCPNADSHRKERRR